MAKRGSKPGVKRGSYKKNKLEDDITKDFLKLRSKEAVKELREKTPGDLYSLENNDNVVNKNIENSIEQNHNEFKESVKEAIEENKINIEIDKDDPVINNLDSSIHTVIEKKEPIESEGDRLKRESRERNKQFEQTGEQAHEDWMKEYKDVSEKSNHSSNQNTETENEQNEKQKRQYTKRNKTTIDSDQALRDANAQFMNGGMLLTFCDLIFPGVILWFFQKIRKNPKAFKVKHTDLCLTDDQTASLEKVADYAAAIIFEKVNPLVLFIMSIGSMYYMNMKIKLDEA